MTMTGAFVSAMLAITLLPKPGAALFQQSTPKAASAARAAQTPVNADPRVIADFTKRVQQYHDLRDKLDEGAARQTQTKEPAKLVAEKQTLASRVQAARAGAKPGDIFTPDAQQAFRRLLKPTLKGTDGAENKKMIQEDSPPAIAVKVNAPYPEKQPLSTMPPDLLKQLPQLPKDLEYRFVQKHLILFDSRSNLVVDVLPNAIS